MANSTIPSSYVDARRLLTTGRDPAFRKVANNTYLHLVQSGVLDAHGRDLPSVAVQYHNTIIALFEHNGRITLRTGGWNTSTTKERLNIIAGARATIFQRKGQWYVQNHQEGWQVADWEEGYTLWDNDQGISAFYDTHIECGD